MKLRLSGVKIWKFRNGKDLGGTKAPNISLSVCCCLAHCFRKTSATFLASKQEANIQIKTISNCRIAINQKELSIVCAPELVGNSYISC